MARVVKTVASLIIFTKQFCVSIEIEPYQFLTIVSRIFASHTYKYIQHEKIWGDCTVRSNEIPIACQIVVIQNADELCRKSNYYSRGGVPYVLRKLIFKSFSMVVKRRSRIAAVRYLDAIRANIFSKCSQIDIQPHWLPTITIAQPKMTYYDCRRPRNIIVSVWSKS